MRKKTLTLVLALVLVLFGVVGGTVAWLTADTPGVVNTFTTSDIDITLTETTGNEYKMVPGYTISKDPKVTVEVGSEDCYLFVKLEKSSNFDNFLTYEIADEWTALTDTNSDGIADDGVYYRIVKTADMGKPYDVLKQNQVTVLGTVTKEMMNSVTETTRPTLTVTAYASQLNKNSTDIFTAIEAWTNIAG